MKIVLKKTIWSIFSILALPFILLQYLSSWFSKEGLFSSISQFLCLLPGKTGCYFRVAFYRYALSYCHPNIVIGFATIFSQRDTDIHEGVYIGPQCNIGKCKIDKNTLIASGVHIMSGNKQHLFDNLTTPIQQQGGEFEKITIGEDSWIGNGSLVMANIGKKCIIGAGSVVTKPIPDYSIAVGNPAKVIKNRTV